MHALGPAITGFLFQGASGEVQPGSIEESAVFVGAGQPDQAGEGVGHVAKTAVALLQAVFGFDTAPDLLLQGGVHAGDVPGHAAQAEKGQKNGRREGAAVAGEHVGKADWQIGVGAETRRPEQVVHALVIQGQGPALDAGGPGGGMIRGERQQADQHVLGQLVRDARHPGQWPFRVKAGAEHVGKSGGMTLVDDAQRARVQAAFPGHGFQQAGSHQAHIGPPRQHAFHHFLVVTGEQDGAGVLFQVDALFQGLAQVDLPAPQAGLVGDRQPQSAQVGIAVDPGAVGAGENHAAELVQGAAGAGHEARGHVADAAAHLHFRVVPAVGDDQFHLPALDRAGQSGKGEGNDLEAERGQFRVEIVGVGRPFLAGIVHPPIGQHADADGVRSRGRRFRFRAGGGQRFAHQAQWDDEGLDEPPRARESHASLHRETVGS